MRRSSTLPHFVWSQCSSFLILEIASNKLLRDRKLISKTLRGHCRLSAYIAATITKHQSRAKALTTISSRWSAKLWNRLECGSGQSPPHWWVKQHFASGSGSGSGSGNSASDRFHVAKKESKSDRDAKNRRRIYHANAQSAILWRRKKNGNDDKKKNDDNGCEDNKNDDNGYEDNKNDDNGYDDKETTTTGMMTTEMKTTDTMTTTTKRQMRWQHKRLQQIRRKKRRQRIR